MSRVAALQTDALIVGAGPTGLTLGIALLLQGRSVVIIDKHLAGLPYSRAILINGETMGALQPLGISQTLRAAGQPVDGFELHIDGALRCVLPNPVDPATGPLLLPQLVTERILCERYLQLGGTLHRGYSFTAPAGRRDGSAGQIDLLPTESSQPVLQIQCQWLFGCDGMHSSVRTALGLGWHGRSQPEQGHAMDATLVNWPFSTNAALYAGADGMALALRIGPRTLRIAGTTAAHCRAVLDQLPVEALTWDASFNIQFMTADTYGIGQTWLAGDATHVHSPIGGRGMNMGIADALALAAAVGSQQLADYGARRKPVAARWVRINYVLSRVLMGGERWAQMLRWTLRICIRLLLALGGQRWLLPVLQRLIRVDPSRSSVQ